LLLLLYSLLNYVLYIFITSINTIQRIFIIIYTKRTMLPRSKILLDIENNFVGTLKIMKQCCKKCWYSSN